MTPRADLTPPYVLRGTDAGTKLRHIVPQRQLARTPSSLCSYDPRYHGGVEGTLRIMSPCTGGGHTESAPRRGRVRCDRGGANCTRPLCFRRISGASVCSLTVLLRRTMPSSLRRTAMVANGPATCKTTSDKQASRSEVHDGHHVLCYSVMCVGRGRAFQGLKPEWCQKYWRRASGLQTSTWSPQQPTWSSANLRSAGSLCANAHDLCVLTLLLFRWSQSCRL